MRNSVAPVVVLLIASGAMAADWPQWLGPKRDGSSTEVVKPWKEPLKILWKKPVGEAHGGPVVANGKTYLFYRTPGKNEETLAAFDAVSGKPIWNTTYPRHETKIAFGNGPRGVPCVADGKIYTFGITSILTCFDAADGKIDWQVDCEKEYKAPTLTFGSSCSPIVVGDNVLVNVGAKGASIVAFDKRTGKEVWKKLDDGASYSSPIVIDPKQAVIDLPKPPPVVFLTAKGLVSLNSKDGAIRWKYPFADFILESSCTPVAFDGKVLASSITAGCVLLEMDAKNSKVTKVWSNSLNCYFSTPVALGKDTLYMVTGSLLEKTAVLRCVDATNGKEHWSRKNVGKYHATLLRTGDNKMLMVEEKGDLVLFHPNPKEYSELARSKICGNTWAHPALANGRLYIRDANDLICVEMPK
jgi:outer membrane protein assembly factor BamB